MFAGARAQSGDIYSTFSIGGGIGVTTVYDYTLQAQNKSAINGTLSYNISPFFSITGEAQMGGFQGGDITAFNMKHFTNSYKALLLHADLQAGEITDYSRSNFLYALKDCYVGTGFGILKNDITYVQSVFPNSDGTEFYKTVTSSSNFLVPIIFGYDWKIFNAYDEPRVRINISYTINTVFGSGIDGYVTTAPVKFYSYFSVGVKLGFGGGQLYRKPVHY